MEFDKLTKLVTKDTFMEWLRIQGEGAINMHEAGVRYPHLFPREVLDAIRGNYPTLKAHYSDADHEPAKRPKVMSLRQQCIDYIKRILTRAVGDKEGPPPVPHDEIRKLMSMRQSNDRFEICATDQSLFSSIEALLQQNSCELIYDENIISELFPDEWKRAKAVQAADPDNYLEVAWQTDSTPDEKVNLDEPAALLACWMLGKAGPSFDHDSVRSIQWQQKWKPFNQHNFEMKCSAALQEMSNVFTGCRKQLPNVPKNVVKLYIDLHTREPNSFNIDSKNEQLRMMMAQDALGAYIDDRILTELYPDSVDTERDNFYFGGQRYRPGEDLDSIAKFPLTGSAAVVTCWLAKCLRKDKREKMLRDIPWLVDRIDDERLVNIATNLIAGRKQPIPFIGNKTTVAAQYFDPLLEIKRSTVSAKKGPGAVADVLKLPDVQAAVKELYGYDHLKFTGGQRNDVIVTVNKDTAMFVIIVAMHTSAQNVQTWQTCS